MLAGKPMKRVLVVDDEALLLKSLTRMLNENYSVTTAQGGEEALAKIQEQEGKFDVILTDLSMPLMSGSELYSRLSAKYPGLETKMIFMTGGAFTPAAREFLSSIPNTQLEKPFTYETLSRVIDGALRGCKK